MAINEAPRTGFFDDFYLSLKDVDVVLNCCWLFYIYCACMHDVLVALMAFNRFSAMFFPLDYPKVTPDTFYNCLDLAAAKRIYLSCRLPRRTNSDSGSVCRMQQYVHRRRGDARAQEDLCKEGAIS